MVYLKIYMKLWNIIDYLLNKGMQQVMTTTYLILTLQTNWHNDISIAQNNLGYCYQYGQGVDKDLQQAVQYYKQSAEQGKSQYNFILSISCK